MSRNNHRHPGRHAVALSALLLACASAGGVAVAADRAKISDGMLVPAGGSSPTYGASGEAKCPSGGPALDLVVQQLTDAAKRAGRNPPVVDARACDVAEAFLGWEPERHGTPRPQVLSFISYWYGLPVPVQEPVVAVLETGEFTQVAESVAGSAAGSAVLNAVQGRIGLATQTLRRRRNERHTRVAVVVVDAAVELDPFPRALALGKTATLSGRLLAQVKDPKVLVSDATGRLSTPEQAPGTAFRAEVACGEKPGKILVEIRGEYEGREGIVASFPVACGTELPTSVALAGEPWPEEVSAAERRILERVNAERVQVGLKPLAWDDAVSRVARDISGDLAASGGASAGMDLRERLKAEGIVPTLMLQSAVADLKIERAHERLLNSPSNRANLLNPDPSLAGIGVVAAKDPSGVSVFYVTEILVKEPPPVDLEKARQDLRDAVARKRRDARAPALSPDAGLDEQAQAYALALAAAGGNLPKEKAAALTASVNQAFRNVTIVAGARRETLDLAEEPQMTSAGKLLGVGIAQGRHASLGRNAVYAVIVIASPKR